MARKKSDAREELNKLVNNFKIIFGRNASNKYRKIKSSDKDKPENKNKFVLINKTVRRGVETYDFMANQEVLDPKIEMRFATITTNGKTWSLVVRKTSGHKDIKEVFLGSDWESKDPLLEVARVFIISGDIPTEDNIALAGGTKYFYLH